MFTGAELPATAGVQADGSWQSVGWAPDPWQRYHGGQTLVLEHGLGYTPAVLLVYLSFSDDGSGAALGTGNLVRVLAVTEDRVEVRNDTNSDLYARVVLR